MRRRPRRRRRQPPPNDPARARDRTVLALAALLSVVAAGLTSRLSIKSDLSYLLPESTPSVRQLRAIERRARVAATFMIGVESADPAARDRAGQALLRRIRALDTQALRIAGVTADDGVLRQYTWDNRFLFASLDDLTAARDALRDRAMKENPLYVPLDDAPAGGGSGDSLDALRRRLDEARAKAGHPQPLVSADGRLQLIIVRADFNGGDLDRGARLTAALNGAVDATARESALWENLTRYHLYLTGGVGSEWMGEKFAARYDLPNDRAYAESCAGIGLVF
ncbi:MAG TPA: beta-L-arabinofuranosidase domain-containing protein, partial [Polyangia bacterium]|nr:beta-L-arabinofuranosidase domain-containing protein [Polyangia bacterium]